MRRLMQWFVIAFAVGIASCDAVPKERLVSEATSGDPRLGKVELHIELSEQGALARKLVADSSNTVRGLVILFTRRHIPGDSGIRDTVDVTNGIPALNYDLTIEEEWTVEIEAFGPNNIGLYWGGSYPFVVHTGSNTVIGVTLQDRIPERRFVISIFHQMTRVVFRYNEEMLDTVLPPSRAPGGTLIRVSREFSGMTSSLTGRS